MGTVDVVDQRERERFEAFARDVADPLRRYLLRRTDPSTADDALSDALLVCWRRRREIPQDAVPWAFGVARLCLRNAERSRRRQDRVSLRIARDRTQPQVQEPEKRFEHPDLDVRDAIASMRPADAEIIRLWAWEELQPAQIAEALDISPNAASIRLHRAKTKLKDALRKTTPTDGHERQKGGTR